jgi:hypothetical protein
VSLDLLKEVLQAAEELTLPSDDIAGNYAVRKAFIARALAEQDNELKTFLEDTAP